MLQNPMESGSQEDEDRVILKIRFVNLSYEEVREKLIEHLMIILSKGKLDLHNNIIYTFVERATTRIKNNTLTEDTVKFLYFSSLHESHFQYLVCSLILSM